MFERVRSYAQRRLLRQELRSAGNFRRASTDAQLKAIHNAKQKIISELARIMHNLNDAFSEQGKFQISLASASNSFFRQVRQQEAGLAELERMVETGEGASMKRLEGAKLEFKSISQMDRYYSKKIKHLQKSARSLERTLEKDEQYVMQHIFDIEYIRLLMAYFAYLSGLEQALRRKGRRLDRKDLKGIRKEGGQEKQAAEELAGQ